MYLIFVYFIVSYEILGYAKISITAANVVCVCVCRTGLVELLLHIKSHDHKITITGATNPMDELGRCQIVFVHRSGLFHVIFMSTKDC